jgi:D-glycero-alpha-D-manno-heptose 1-phosphate guanylyltransferase
MKEAIVLAGGLGTRLRHIVPDLPKSMAPVNGRPFISYVLAYLARQKISTVIVAAGYRHEQIISGIGKRFMNMDVKYSIEDEPLGTGGAMLKAFSCTGSGSCLVLNGDTLFTVDIASFTGHFIEKRPAISVAVKPMENFDRYGNITLEGERIKSFNEKKFCRKGIINGGVYLVNKEWMIMNSPGPVFSFEKDILQKKAVDEMITGYISDTYFIDIGVPEDYFRAERELADPGE